MTSGASTSSVVELLDPRTKFFAVVLLAAQIFVFTSPASVLGATAIVTAAAIASRISFRGLLRRLRLVFWFAVIITAVNMLTLDGETMFEFAGLYATKEGLIRGVLLSVKVVLMLWTSMIFISTTSIPRVMEGIEVLARPFRKRFGAAIMVMTLTLNFVPSLVHTAQRIKKAQLARGADTDSGFTRQLSHAISAALPLFAAAFRSSEHLALAMESRCYDPTRERSHFSMLRMTRTDWCVIVGLIAILAALTLSSWGASS